MSDTDKGFAVRKLRRIIEKETRICDELNGILRTGDVDPLFVARVLSAAQRITQHLGTINRWLLVEQAEAVEKMLAEKRTKVSESAVLRTRRAAKAWVMCEYENLRDIRRTLGFMLCRAQVLGQEVPGSVIDLCMRERD